MTYECPACGSERLVEMVFGLPSEELAQRAERGEVVLGGCMVGLPGGDPTHQCRACGRSFRETTEGLREAQSHAEAVEGEPEDEKRPLADIGSEIARARSLQKYGLTPLDYKEMIEAQSGRCAICGTTKSGVAGGVWAVDHNHVTRRVRALLCSDCNAGLGLFGDDPGRLRAAAVYLETVQDRPRWQDLPPIELADYLIRHVTIADRGWTNRLRRREEKREAFIRRILLSGEER